MLNKANYQPRHKLRSVLLVVVLVNWRAPHSISEFYEHHSLIYTLQLLNTANGYAMT